MLYVGEDVVKRYRVPSPTQEAVLDAFEEEGWPDRIDDPLRPDPDQDGKRHLHDTIRRLNRNRRAAIHFSGDGTGTGVLWELTLKPRLAIDGRRAAWAARTIHRRVGGARKPVSMVRCATGPEQPEMFPRVRLRA